MSAASTVSYSLPTSKTPLAGLHVPDDHAARLAAAAAAGQQQAAVAGELEDVDRPLGERQDADQMAGRRVL